MRRLLVSLLICAAPLSAQESVLNRAYSAEKLDGFWQATLGGSGAQPALYDMFGAAAVPAPVTAVPTGFAGLPDIGEVIGESAPTAPTPQRLSFPVIPLADDEAGPMMRRLAWAEIYLSRYRHYTPASSDPSALVTALAERQLAAALEAYLATARLYFAAATLPEKCERLTRLQALAQGPLALAGADVTPPDGWDALPALRSAAATRLNDTALTGMVCGIEPVRGRAETAQRIRTQVGERMAQEARDKVDDTLVLLESEAERFQDLVNRMDVTIKTAEILELERVFGNAAANVRLVQTDQLNADGTLAELEAVDLGALRQPGEVAEYQQAQAQMAQMITLMDGVLTELAALAEVDPARLSACAGLETLYDAPDLRMDTGTLTALIEGPYANCLNQARGLVELMNATTEQSAAMAVLAGHVAQISENLLEAMRP